MRDDQVRLVDALVAVGEDVHVDHPRSPALGSNPAHGLLDGQACSQKVAR